jgi:hypothetical protein
MIGDKGTLMIVVIPNNLFTAGVGKAEQFMI